MSPLKVGPYTKLVVIYYEPSDTITMLSWIEQSTIGTEYHLPFQHYLESYIKIPFVLKWPPLQEHQAKTYLSCKEQKSSAALFK